MRTRTPGLTQLRARAGSLTKQRSNRLVEAKEARGIEPKATTLTCTTMCLA